MAQSQTNIRGLWRENRRLEKQRDELQRDLAQTKAAMAVQADSLKRRIADLENAQADIEKQRDELLAALIEARQALQFANDSPGGGIDDTIWMMHRNETLFDFMDAAIASVKGGAA